MSWREDVCYNCYLVWSRSRGTFWKKKSLKSRSSTMVIPIKSRSPKNRQKSRFPIEWSPIINTLVRDWRRYWDQLGSVSGNGSIIQRTCWRRFLRNRDLPPRKLLNAATLSPLVMTHRLRESDGILKPTKSSLIVTRIPISKMMTLRHQKQVC